MTHPKREIETSLDNFVADAFAERSECDVMLVGSGSLRVKKIGPAVTLKDFLTCFPYDDILIRYVINGRQFKQIFNHIMRIENRDGEGENYQVNKKVKVVYSDSKKKLQSLTVDGKPVSDKNDYTVCMQNFHASNTKVYLGISQEDLLASGKSKVITTSAQEVLEEYFRNHNNTAAKVEGEIGLHYLNLSIINLPANLLIKTTDVATSKCSIMDVQGLIFLLTAIR